MSHIERVELLLKRALAFLKNVEENLKVKSTI